jgi:S-adenosylmethionine synthetase
MSHLVVDENKIDSLVSSYHDTEQLVFAGSDEQLDLILNMQNSINKLVKLSRDVSEELETAFNSLSEEQAKNVVIKLSSALSTAKQLITLLKNLPHALLEGTKSCRKDLYLETKQIDEFVQDIIKYKINSPKELTDLLKEIK